MRKIYPLSAVLVVGLGLLLHAQDGPGTQSTASLRGRIVFQGIIPPTPTPRMAADPNCASLALPPQQQLDDVIVYARPISQTSFPVPASSVVLEQRDCRFVPHTITLQAGQKLLLRNDDRTAQNVHAWPVINNGFNFALPRRGAETVQVFQKEEDPFPIRCDVHNWEVAYVGVFSHPYHVVSKLNGEYEFKLPAGAYEIVVWHERLGKQSQSFGVGAGDNRELNFVFK